MIRDTSNRRGLIVLDKLLLCVGAQKAGTSWLHKVLAKSPEIEFSRHKEVHYFDMRAGLNNQLPNRIIQGTAQQFGYSRDKFLQRLAVDEKTAVESVKSVLDDEWYCAQFRRGGTYCADFTPEYAMLGMADFEEMARIARKIKVIFIMRDPVERSLSAFRYYHQNRGIDTRSMSDRKVLKLLKSRLFAGRSDYPSVVEKLSRCFAGENVHYLFYEEVMRDKETALLGICNFLDIPAIELPQKTLNARVNTTEPQVFSETIYKKLGAYYADDKRVLKERFGELPSEWQP